MFGSQEDLRHSILLQRSRCIQAAVVLACFADLWSLDASGSVMLFLVGLRRSLAVNGVRPGRLLLRLEGWLDRCYLNIVWRLIDVMALDGGTGGGSQRRRLRGLYCLLRISLLMLLGNFMRRISIHCIESAALRLKLPSNAFIWTLVDVVARKCSRLILNQ